MVIANFKENTHVSTYGLCQYDYGQILRIQGLNLPTAVEIHFALQERGGDSVTRVGMTKDGVTDVVIPDSMLENNDTNQDYNIYAFVYLTDETSGQTEYRIKMPVESRPRPEAFDRPEDVELFREAIQAVNESAERAESAAEESEKNAQRTAEDRETVKEMVTTVSDIKEQVQEVKEYKEQAQTAATNALLSENESEKAKEEAVKAQAGAESAADTAEQHALEVVGDKVEVEQLAGQVRQDKTSVEQTVQGFGNTVQQAEQFIGNVGVQMVQKVTEDGTKQVKSIEKKGQEVIDSIPEDFPTQMESKLDKNQGAGNAGKALVIGEDGDVVSGEVQSSGGDTNVIKLIDVFEITQPVNEIVCDFVDEYDAYYIIGNLSIGANGTVIFYPSAKNIDGSTINLKFYDTYGNTGKTLTVSIVMRRKKKEDGSYMLRINGLYTNSDYVLGKFYTDTIDTGWINNDIDAKKLLKYAGFILDGTIDFGHLEIYGGV